MSRPALARRAAPVLALALLLPAALAAQAPLGLTEVSAGGGLEFRRFAFESGFAVDETRQLAVPIAVALPLGRRFTVDIGSAWATTSVESGAGDFTVSGFTDTQVRASYTFGADAVVASVLVNLPTGLETNSAEDFFVASAVASNFLLFPVNVFGTANMSRAVLPHMRRQQSGTIVNTCSIVATVGLAGVTAERVGPAEPAPAPAAAPSSSAPARPWTPRQAPAERSP